MTKFGEELIQSMQEALAYTRGEEVPGMRVTHVDVPSVDARKVRRKLGLTQVEIAPMLGTSVSGYRKWEQGTRRPSGAALTLLRVMEREPEAVLRALMPDR